MIRVDEKGQALTWHASSFNVVKHILKQGQGQELASAQGLRNGGLVYYSQLLGRV
jgi:hypothetical protein